MQSLHDMQSGKAVVAAAVTTAFMHMMRSRLSCATSLRKNIFMPTHPPVHKTMHQGGGGASLIRKRASCRTAIVASQGA